MVVAYHMNMYLVLGMTTPVRVPMRGLLRELKEGELKEDPAVDRALTILKKLGETYTASSQHRQLVEVTAIASFGEYPV